MKLERFQVSVPLAEEQSTPQSSHIIHNGQSLQFTVTTLPIPQIQLLDIHLLTSHF
jgi:hypothetical protein